jgi:hypothetical protein
MTEINPVVSVKPVMPEQAFSPSLLVIHRYRKPNPWLPINYDYFLHVELPAFTAALPLKSQLLVAKKAASRRLAYPFPGPFGAIEAFAFRRSNRQTVYLSPEGEFEA